MTVPLHEEHFPHEHYAKLFAIFKRIPSKSVWSRVDRREDIQLKRFDEGYINDVCLCTLTETAVSRLAPGPDDSLGVVVKIFAVENSTLPSRSLNRALIHCVVSQANLSPKLLYVDDECCVNEFLPNARHQNCEDDADDQFVESAFRKIAQFHYLNVPISSMADKWSVGLLMFRDKYPGSAEVLNGKVLQFIAEDDEFRVHYDSFAAIKWANGFLYFPEASKRLDTVIVFNHLDFHRANRLVSVDPSTGTKELFYIDFDTAMYSYRGFDFGAFFSTFLNEDNFSIEAVASDETMLKWIDVYRAECVRILGAHYLEQDINSRETILREAKFFMIYYFFLYDYFSVSFYCQNPKAEKNREFLRKVFVRQGLVEKLVRQYTQDGILVDVGIAVR